MRKTRLFKRMGRSAAIFMTAILEYVTRELLDLAGTIALMRRIKTIYPIHIRLGIQEDEEFLKLMYNVIFSTDVAPGTEARIFGKRAKK